MRRAKKKKLFIFFPLIIIINKLLLIPSLKNIFNSIMKHQWNHQIFIWVLAVKEIYGSYISKHIIFTELNSFKWVVNYFK